MAKLRTLVEVTSQALGVPVESVNVLAMKLRAERLIRSAGRGLNAAEMDVADAVALLTATLSGGAATETASTTRRVLAANYLGPRVLSPDLPLPPLDGVALPKEHTFGQAFTAVLGAVLAGDADSVMVEVAVQRSVWRHFCSLRLRRYDAESDFSYSAWSNEVVLAEYPADVASKLIEERGGRKTTESITERELRAVAAVLRE